MTSDLKKNNISLIKKGLFYIALIGTSILIALVSLDFLNIDWDTYCSISRDSAATEAIIKSIQENGISGLFYNPRVGAPNAAASWVDAPGIDLFLGILIWLLNLIFHPSTQRLYYYTLIATFILTSWSMSLVLNKLKVNAYINFVISLLFSFGPYHFYRYMYHIALGNAFSIPLAVLLCFFILGIVKEDNTKKTKILYAIYSLLIGLACPYYTFFAFIIFAVSFLFIILDKEKFKERIKRTWVIGFVLLGLLISRLPAIFINILKGKNPIAFVRLAEEQEVFALKIIQLLLPVKYSRIKPLAAITENYYSHFQFATENYMSSLGIVASIGFIALCSLLVYSFIKHKKNANSGFDWLLIDFMSLSTLCLVLVSDTGGFGEIFNMIVTPQFRCYNRVSVLITCFSLVIIAYLLDKYLNGMKSVLYIVASLVLGIGLYDQVNVADMRTERQSYKYWQDVYGSFFAEVEASCESGDMIYQLPFMGYPEVNNINNLERSKHFIGYLYTNNLRWSFGGIMGRDTLAEEMYIDEGMSDAFVSVLKQVGFRGVYIDVTGYEDYGQQVLTYYYGLGIEPIVSADGTLYYFDLSNL